MNHLGQRKYDFFNDANIDENNNLKVTSSKNTLFNESITISPQPIVQNYAPYGIISNKLYSPFTATGGTVTSNSNGVELDYNITTSVGSYAILRSKKVVKYRPGYSNLIRTSGRFNTGINLSLQFIGVGNAGSDLYFAYNGVNFGVRRSYGGYAEVRTLTITTASSTVETANVTLNGVLYTVSLTNNGTDTNFTAHQCENGTYTPWNIDHIDNTIVFSSKNVGPLNGTYSFSSATAVGTFSQNKAGQALTTEFVAQTDWNGVSNMKTLLQPSRNNLYEIEYSWFGTSNIYFRIYNPETSKFENVHTMKFSNIGSNLSLTQPNMYCQNGIASLGSTTAMTLNTTCSVASTLCEKNTDNVPTYTISNEKSISSNTETNVIVLKNRNTINGYANQSQTQIYRVTVAVAGTKPVRIKITKNPTTVGNSIITDYDKYQYIDAVNSITIYDTLSTTYTGGSLQDSFYIAKDGGLIIEYINSTVNLEQESIIVVSAFSTGANVVSVTVSLREDL